MKNSSIQWTDHTFNAWEGSTKIPMKPSRPTTELTKRLAAIVHRRDSTPWSEKEIRAYKKLYRAGAFNERDLSSVERFQAFQRKRGEKGFHRRALFTLFNRWSEEVDHGTEHDELHPLKPIPRKIIPLHFPGEPWVEPTDAESVAALARFEEQRRLRKQGKAEPPRSFQEVREIMQGPIV